MDAIHVEVQGKESTLEEDYGAGIGDIGEVQEGQALIQEAEGGAGGGCRDLLTHIFCWSCWPLQCCALLKHPFLHTGRISQGMPHRHACMML